MLATDIEIEVEPTSTITDTAAVYESTQTFGRKPENVEVFIYNYIL